MAQMIVTVNKSSGLQAAIELGVKVQAVLINGLVIDTDTITYNRWKTRTQFLVESRSQKWRASAWLNKGIDPQKLKHRTYHTRRTLE